MGHIVVLDYGHGGSKAGAVVGNVQEKQLNLWTGREIYDELHGQKNGNDLQVVLTRDDDYDVPLGARCRMINACNDQHSVDLAVSVHYNAAGVESAHGFEVYYHENSTNGKKAAELVVDAVKAAGIDVRGRGAKTTAQLGRKLAFIHKIKPPAILLEVGFLTNTADRTNAIDPAWRAIVSRQVAAGIWNYLS